MYSPTESGKIRWGFLSGVLCAAIVGGYVGMLIYTRLSPNASFVSLPDYSPGDPGTAPAERILERLFRRYDNPACYVMLEHTELVECMWVGPYVKGGVGTAIGPWHELSSGAPPGPGFKLLAYRFDLQGPHGCRSNFTINEKGTPGLSKRWGATSEMKGGGEWSGCEEVQSARVPYTLVKWRFWFQGWTEYHVLINDKGVGAEEKPVAISQRGVIRTIWMPAESGVQ